MLKIDLNCDLGESFGHYKLGLDEDIIPFITSANVACGYHASDPLVMEQTVMLAKKHGVHIGAHPGLPDLMGFGRRDIKITEQEAKAYIKYQVGALYAFCKAQDIPLSYVKPHGALYNMAAKDYKLARAICESIYEFDKNLILLGLSGSEMIRAANEIGLKAAKEVFADRAYEEDGTLVVRSNKGAMITEEEVAINRVVRMIKEGKLTAINGKDIVIEVDSICVHGDGIKALEFVKRIRTTLEKEDIIVQSFS